MAIFNSVLINGGTEFSSFIHSPLEQFEVVSLISLNAPLFGYLNIALTNLALYSMVVLTIVVGFHILGNNDVKLIPSK